MIMRRLARDSRKGVRAVHDQLQRRHAEEKRRQRRRDEMLHLERVLWKSGIARIAGVDEAGVGPLAGPVVAAAVVFPPHCEIEGIDDSKRLDESDRERIAPLIRERAKVGIGIAEVGEIDELNVYHAALAAMRRAVESLPSPPEHLLVDARQIPELEVPQNRLDRGDGLAYSIAAASIVAKTERDAMMLELHERYPEYGFASHKGYGTAEHQEAIRHHGVSPAHRRSFSFLRELTGRYSQRFYDLAERLGEASSRPDLRDLQPEIERALDELPDDESRKLRLLWNRSWERL